MAETNPQFSAVPLARGQRLALCVEYDGSAFSGWQAQPQLPSVDTVQEAVELALGTIAAKHVRVHCAGRTDTGVHATSQWIHFDAPAERSLKSWIVGCNAQLPETVRITHGKPVSGDFHARHSAVARQYDYLIANTRTASALLSRRVLWVRSYLDEKRMHTALQGILGERDFSAFRAAACQSRTPMRFLEAASVSRRGEFLQIRLVANAFLHHMVRNIVGSLIPIGLAEAEEDWLETLLDTRDRTKAAATAPPHGLYLTDVRYPERHAMPHATSLPILFKGF